MTRPLATSASATPANVGRLRRTLRDWLSEVLDDPDVIDDLTLATGEALENAADHAYTAHSAVGVMRLHAAVEADCITIVVSDDGRWQAPGPDPGFRGRGIDLMDRLVDVSRVSPGADGTSVVLVHRRAVARRSGS